MDFLTAGFLTAGFLTMGFPPRWFDHPKAD
jgi:hypothetical protein